MFQFLGIVASVVGLILAFASVRWAWLPPALMTGLLYLLYFAVRTRKYGPVSDLSWKANELLGRFGHFYAMPFAARSVSAAASITALASGAIGIISAFRGFWWGLGAGVLLYILVAPLARQFNPENFLVDDAERAAHDEIVQWLGTNLTEQSPE